MFNMLFASKGTLMMPFIKTSAKLILLGLGLFGLSANVPANAAEIYVIAHPSVKLTLSEIRDVYLGEKQFAGSLKLAPVDNVAVQGEFLAKAINMDASKYAALWIKKGFRGGLAAPPVKAGDAEVISYVKNTVGAIGYISTPPTAGVQQLSKY